ncbi:MULTISPECIES: MFS transporter [Niallia]|jgi:MFS transporter, DHA1 family, multidrug resistance protein|uniref:MFS transporter n=1 Tax=Niallia circulans TaxID=1397 RepID=A0A268FBA8_NIACI|nr:MFS transporter [Niallia circulans]AYV69486.1 MFS transporter [Niallia circulans]AYV72127.1 MFS transporter [Niallia circulans]PAD82658.1 MFS transporter [Niallia circulans]QJX60971.1 MFS transporter [Niallia circulans]
MEIWKRNLLVLWIGVFFTSASFNMVIPFLPIFLIELNVHENTEIWAGVLFSAAFFAGAFASPFWGRLADKYGRKPMIIRAGFVLFVVYTLAAFVTNPYQLLVLRILQGLLSGFIPGAIALIGTNTPSDKTGYALSMISTASASGGIMGPLIGGVISQLVGNRLSFASAGLLVFIATLLIIFWVKEDNFSPSKEKGSVRNDLRIAFANKPLMLVLLLTIVTSCSIMTIEPILPLYILEIGGSMDKASLLAGIIFSLPGIASVIMAPYWGKWADKVGFNRVLFIGLLGGGLGTFSQIIFSNIWGFSITRFIFGLFFCAVFPALNGLVVKSTAEDFRGRAFSLNQTANQLGGMFGPMIGGFLGGVLPAQSVFIVTGILLIVATGIAYKKGNIFSPTMKQKVKIVTHGK